MILGMEEGTGGAKYDLVSRLHSNPSLPDPLRHKSSNYERCDTMVINQIAQSDRSLSRKEMSLCASTQTKTIYKINVVKRSYMLEIGRLRILGLEYCYDGKSFPLKMASLQNNSLIKAKILIFSS